MAFMLTQLEPIQYISSLGKEEIFQLLPEVQHIVPYIRITINFYGFYFFSLTLLGFHWH